MARIRKPGLNYFPIDTDFFQSRPVRRLMKATDDAGAAVLVQLMCQVYAGEGYYLAVSDDYFDDLADLFYHFDAAFVKRVVEEAVKVGIFDAELYGRCSVLTSAEIQQQYLACRRLKDASAIDERYRLIADAKPEDEGEAAAMPCASEAGEPGAQTCPQNAKNVGLSPKNVSLSSKSTENVYQGTQNKEKENKANENKPKQSIENPLPVSSPETGGTPETARRAVEGLEELFKSRKVYSLDDVRRLQPPADGLDRNLDGLLFNLAHYRVPPAEQYAIVKLSNFGVIGHPVWRGFEPLRTSHGKIRQPGRYLLSLCNKRE